MFALSFRYTVLHKPIRTSLKLGMGVIHKKLSNQHTFRENQRSDIPTLHKGHKQISVNNFHTS